MKTKYDDTSGRILAIILVIGFIVGILGISFLITSFVYWLFTVVMSYFFFVSIPFTWNYALGVWLIVQLINVIFGGIHFSVSE